MKVCKKCGVEKSLEMFYKHPGMTDGHKNTCKECLLFYKSEKYRSENPEILRSGKEFRKTQSELITKGLRICVKCGEEKSLGKFNKNHLCHAGYEHRCKDCAKKYQEENKEEISKQRSEYYKNNLEKCKDRMKENYKNNRFLRLYDAKVYRKKNKETISARRKKWSKENGVKINTRFRNRYHNNPLFRLITNMRNQFRDTLRKYSKQDIKRDYSLTEIANDSRLAFLIKYKEIYDPKIHDVDHIIPISAFGELLFQKEFVEMADCIDNLRPMLISENRWEKSDKITEDCYKNPVLIEILKKIGKYDSCMDIFLN